MKIARWGNSTAVRLPTDVLDAAGFATGDEVTAEVENGAIVLRRVRSREEILASFERFRGTMPEGFKFDRVEANARR